MKSRLTKAAKLLSNNRTVSEEKIRRRTIETIYGMITRHPGLRSRTKFAQRIFTTPQAVHKWEHLDGFPTVQNLADICEQFEIDANWLLLGKGKMMGDADLLVRIEVLETRVTVLENIAGIEHENISKKVSKKIKKSTLSNQNQKTTILTTKYL